MIGMLLVEMEEQNQYPQLEKLRIDIPREYLPQTCEYNDVKNSILFDFLTERIGLDEAVGKIDSTNSKLLKDREYSPWLMLIGEKPYTKTNLLLDWYLRKKEEVNQPLSQYKKLFTETEPNFFLEAEGEWIM